MPFLILYLGEKQKFDKMAIAEGLEQIEGVKPQAPSDGSVLTYRYEYGNDFTTIKLKDDQETIIIDGSGKASLAAALGIQLVYSQEIRLIDENYSFDLVLKGISSLAELEHRISGAGG